MSASAGLTLEEGMAHLASIVGADNLSIRTPAAQTITVVPADAHQIAGVLRFANANGLSVMPTGGRTKLGWGNPLSPDIEISLHRLCELREHAWQDMTCTVMAGCTWTAMQDQLRVHGQMVALDPLWARRATVGGVVATNDSGALRLKYGSLRDLIIGMTVVLADGTIARSGGKVVKNVAGYDIHKLMAGSFGTLAVIVEVNFRLHPFEDHALTWTAAQNDLSPDLSWFRKGLRTLMDSRLAPSCVQLRLSRLERAIDVRLAGRPECFSGYETRIRGVFNGFTITSAKEDIWSARQNLFATDHALILKVAVVPDEICPTAELLQQWVCDGSELSMVAYPTGLMFVAVSGAPGNASQLLERLRIEVNVRGGSVVVLQAPSSLHGAIQMWNPDQGTLPLMREIKRRFDPNRVLNPGRFVGDI